MSEPNQKSAEGCLRRFTGATAWGSTVPSHGASTAMRIMASSTRPPAIAVGWRRSASRKLRQVGETAFGTSSATAAMSVADARIEEHVAQVHREVDEHVGRGKHEHHALDERVVAAQDRVHREPSDAGEGEHGFGDDGTADGQSDPDADH